MTEDRYATIRASSYESLALGTVVPYSLPFAKFGDEKAFSYWWRLLYFAFELPSPYDFPAPPGLLDAEFLHRYCDAAREMASSACLAYPSSVSVEAHRDNDGHWVEMVSSDFPSSEVVRGFIALFRQFYSDGELASFAKVRNALIISATEASDSDASRRMAELRTWGKAHSRLLAYNLMELVGQRLIDEGRLGPEGIPSGGKPKEIISAFAYGDQLHWGDQREVVSRWEADQFFGPWNRMHLLEITAGLAYFYMGFAIIVARSIGRLDEFR